MASEVKLKIKPLKKDLISRKNWTGWHLGAIFSFLGGTGAILAGAGLTAATWVFKPENGQHPLQTLINILFYAALPLFFLGAYFLDKIEELKKRRS